MLRQIEDPTQQRTIERYIFNHTDDYVALIEACTPLINHDQNPPHEVLKIVVANLDNPGSIADTSLIYAINEVLENSEHTYKIINIAVTLYVNLFNELVAMNKHQAFSYFLEESSRRHILIGINYLPF